MSEITDSKPKRQRVPTKRQQARQGVTEGQNDDEMCYLGKPNNIIGNNNNDGDEQDDENSVLPPIPQKFKYGDHTADIIVHGFGNTINESIESLTYGMLSYMFDNPEYTRINPLLTHTITIYGTDIPDVIFRFLTEILAQSINYYDELSTDIQKRIGDDVAYPGMVPRLVNVVSFTEEFPNNNNISTNTNKNDTVIDKSDNITNNTTTTNDDNIQTTNTDEKKSQQDQTTQKTPNIDLNKPKTPGKIFKLIAEIQGDFLDIVKLGQGTEVKAITNELTLLELFTNQCDIDNNEGKYHIQVLVDI